MLYRCRYFCITLLIACCTLMIAPSVCAQSRMETPAASLDNRTEGGALAGVVRNATGEPLIGASVLIVETRKGSASDLNGEFAIKNITPGTYRIEVSFIGYKTASRQATVGAGKTVLVNVILQSAIYMIGGIEVVADQDVLPKDTETKNVIRSGQIEHLQASSLGEVLQLIPGVKATNPDLGSIQQANIRGTDKDVSSQYVGSFGTQIIVDNVPTSNNANMQIDAGSASTTNRGVDLRSIPSENIDNVEVIRGIPSAKFGDMTSGIIKVTTKTGNTPQRLKVKYNPNTFEGNYSGGFNAYATSIGYNVNVASSDRDVRKPGDGYTRLALQLSTVNSFFDKVLSLRNIVNVNRAFDESKEDPSYAARVAYYDRDISGKYAVDLAYRPDNTLTVHGIASLGYTYQNSYRQEIVSRDNLILSDLRVNGVQEGRIVFGSYLSQYHVRGDVWNLYSTIDAEKKFFTGDIIHVVTVGAAAQYDANRGPGRIYDPLYPPPSSANSGDRPRSYSDLPGMTNISLYAEDKVSGRFVVPFTLQLGARFQMFNPEKLRLSGLFGGGDVVTTGQGSFLDPRVNLSFSATDDMQIRIGYGQTSKSPPLASIYPNLKYYDVTDTVSVNPADPTKNFGIVSTYVFDQVNKNLRGFTQYKYEASIDQRLGDVGISMTGFINETKNGFWTVTQPITVLKKSWAQWPDQQLFAIKDTLMDKIYLTTNSYYSTSEGMEFSFRTRRLPYIKTIIEVDGSYTYFNSGIRNGVDYGAQRTDALLGLTVFPMYHTVERYSKDLLLKYRFDVLLEQLHMWFTLNIEQQPVEIDGYRGKDDSLAIGYYSRQGNTVVFTESDRANPLYSNLRRTPKAYELLAEDRPNRWLINFRISKELWKGTEASFFVNNIWDSRPLYQLKRTDPNTLSYERRNPPLYFGLEFSTVISQLFADKQ